MCNGLRYIIRHAIKTLLMPQVLMQLPRGQELLVFSHVSGLHLALCVEESLEVRTLNFQLGNSIVKCLKEVIWIKTFTDRPRPLQSSCY